MDKEGKSPDTIAAKLAVLHEEEGDYTSRIIHLSLDGKKVVS
jgi:hypothetical protein